MHQRKIRSTTKKFWQEIRKNDRWSRARRRPNICTDARAAHRAAGHASLDNGRREGQKYIDGLNLLAVTNPGGAGKWNSDFTPEQIERWFKGGKTAYVLEDNDAPGRKHVEIVGHALHPLVADIRIVSFRELPEKSDVTDWLVSWGTPRRSCSRARRRRRNIDRRRCKASTPPT